MREAGAQATGPTRVRDLLRTPVLGAFLRWRHARTVLQSLCLALAALLILDGLFGPQIAPRNLAGVLPWVHWRGFVVLALLVVGNLFCMACPFMLPRRLAKRILPATRSWPRALGSKWLAVGLLLAFFWAYEAYALWSSPWLTAWVAITYFVLAFVVDGFFKGATFCKHVCPIGQFHFVNGMVSPTEVQIRDPEVCLACDTKDCIRGRYVAGTVPYAADDAPGGRSLLSGDRPPSPGQAYGPVGLVQSGCELALFQPKKEGNLDCTYCMECIHACPHDNVGILLRSPVRELTVDPIRSGVGRISRRPDLVALAAVLIFGAFFNAFGMVTPVVALRTGLGEALGIASGPIVLLLLLCAGLIVLPGLLLVTTAGASRALSSGHEPLAQRIGVYVWAFVPLGIGMWAAHYLFHLLVGGLTIVPVVQEYLADLGLRRGSEASWGLGPMVPESWLLPLEVLVLQFGLFLTLLAGFRIAVREEGTRRLAGRAFLPWGVLATAMFVVGVWLLVQPMEMRGTFQGL